ncbi:MAG: Mth938-like domain-containing protein [Gemmatimonadetes bacterium]|nr:Mth938-like domain-containing protein [Gemmatimonadota bacterium]
MERSPRIEDLDWGRLAVEGREAPYKDAKLWPGGSREWDWNETGTRHVPGVQPADVEEVVEHGAEVVVLGRGILGALRVKDETLEALERAGVEVHVAKTEEAVRRYNELREARPTGGLFHTTC